MTTVSYQQPVAPNVVHYPFIVTIDEYARRCKIAVRSAQDRVKKGYVCHTHLDGVLLIEAISLCCNTIKKANNIGTALSAQHNPATYNHAGRFGQ